MNNYTDILRAHNLKATPQRVAIAELLYLHGHISIDSLYEMMLKTFQSLSLATIYKNINIMVENSFIQEVKIANIKSVYELTKESHSHLVCNKCQNIEDISLDLHSIMSDASKEYGFRVNSTDLVLTGFCKNCA